MAQTQTALGQPAMTQILSKLHDKSADEKKVIKSNNNATGMDNTFIPHL